MTASRTAELYLIYLDENLRFLEQASQQLLQTAGRLTLSLPHEVTVGEAADLTRLTAEVPRAVAQSLEAVQRIAGLVRAIEAESAQAA